MNHPKLQEANKNRMSDLNRRTDTRTFRLYKDQIDFIDSVNGDCASLFMRFLLDVWLDNKIPKEVREEWFRIRKELREKVVS